MPLYNSKRDSGFLLGVNREIMHKISSVEVGIYKLNLDVTTINIYEEVEKRTYKQPIRIFSHILIENEGIESNEVQDMNSNARFGFLHADLIEADIEIHEGDIIKHEDEYFEVDHIINKVYWSGRAPLKSIAVQQDGIKEHGYKIGLIAECHRARFNTLNIENVREETVVPSTKKSNSIPKF